MEIEILKSKACSLKPELSTATSLETDAKNQKSQAVLWGCASTLSVQVHVLTVVGDVVKAAEHSEHGILNLSNKLSL